MWPLGDPGATHPVPGTPQPSGPLSGPDPNLDRAGPVCSPAPAVPWRALHPAVRAACSGCRRSEPPENKMEEGMRRRKRKGVFILTSEETAGRRKGIRSTGEEKEDATPRRRRSAPIPRGRPGWPRPWAGLPVRGFPSLPAGGPNCWPRRWPDAPQLEDGRSLAGVHGFCGDPGKTSGRGSS